LYESDHRFRLHDTHPWTADGKFGKFGLYEGHGEICALSSLSRFTYNRNVTPIMLRRLMLGFIIFHYCTLTMMLMVALLCKLQNCIRLPNFFFEAKVRRLVTSQTTNASSWQSTFLKIWGNVGGKGKPTTNSYGALRNA